MAGRKTTPNQNVLTFGESLDGSSVTGDGRVRLIVMISAITSGQYDLRPPQKKRSPG